MMESILFSLFILLVFSSGIFVGYVLSRKRDDRTVLEPKATPEKEVFYPEESPWDRAMHTEKELEEMKMKREPTIV